MVEFYLQSHDRCVRCREAAVPLCLATSGGLITMLASMRRYAADTMIDSLVRTAIFLSIVVSTEFWAAEPEPRRSPRSRKSADWTVSLRNLFG